MLVARLGLRSIEVARLRLDDIGWRCGEIVVRGKGRREGRLPLPADVGEALAAYLSGPRPRLDARHVFLTCKAPQGPIRADLVGDVVERACRRAGSHKIGPPDCVMPWPPTCFGTVPGSQRSARAGRSVVDLAEDYLDFLGLSAVRHLGADVPVAGDAGLARVVDEGCWFVEGHVLGFPGGPDDGLHATRMTYPGPVLEIIWFGGLK